MRSPLRTLVALLLLATGGIARAQFGDDTVRVQAEAQATKVHPGDQLGIAVIFEMDPSWHIWPPSTKGKVPEALEGWAPEWSRVEPAGWTGGAPSPPPAQTIEGLTLHWPDAQWPEPHLITTAAVSTSPIEILSYADQAVVFVPVVVAADAAPGPRTIKVQGYFQTCDDSVCQQPATVSAEIAIEVVGTGTSIADTPPPVFAAFDPTVFSRLGAGGGAAVAPPGADDHLFDFFGYGFTLKGNQYLLIFLLAAIAGFLLNLTPCVLPVIPIKVLSLQKQAGNPAKLMLFGTVYCVGIIATFAVFGVLIAVLRQQWGQIFSQPWFSATMGAIVLVLGVGMLGLFTLRLPQSVYMINPAGDTLQGNFMMGVLTAILSTPCTGPFLGGALAWAATQPTWVGVTALVIMGVGMASPYALLIAFPGLIDRMPRAGPGGELLKQVLGVLLIAVAIFLFGNLTHAKWPWWVVGGVAAAGFLWAAVGGQRALRTPRGRAVVTALGVLGVASSVGLGYVMTQPSGIPWRVFVDSTGGPGGIQEAIDRGLADGKMVAVKFTAKWCANCHVIENTVFNSGTGLRLLNRPDVIAIKVDLTLNDNTEGWELLRKYSGGTGIPFSIFFHPTGDPIPFRSFFKVSDLESALTPRGR